MLNKDYTAKLLDLVDVIITKVENFSEEVHVYLELAGQRCCICVNGVTAAIAASASLRRTPSFPGTTALPADWLPRSSLRSTKRYLLQRSARSLMFQVQRLCGTSNTFLSGQPNCQRFFPLTNSRVIPEARNITVSL